MIRVITKEYFYNCLGDCKKFNKIILSKYLEPINNKISLDLEDINYFELEGYGVFSYFEELAQVYIPENSNITKELIESDFVDVSDWVLDFLTTDINPKYLKNTFKLPEIDTLLGIRLSDKDLENIEIEDGTYNIRNTRTKEVFQFVLKKEVTYTTFFYIGIEDLLKFPISKKDYTRKFELLNAIIEWVIMKK